MHLVDAFIQTTYSAFSLYIFFLSVHDLEAEFDIEYILFTILSILIVQYSMIMISILGKM